MSLPPKKLTAKEQNRLHELCDNAISIYLDKSDFNVMDYMDKDDQIEYATLTNKDYGDCVSCGEDADKNGKCLGKKTCYLQTLIRDKGRKTKN